LSLLDNDLRRLWSSLANDDRGRKRESQVIVLGLLAVALNFMAKRVLEALLLDTDLIILMTMVVTVTVMVSMAGAVAEALVPVTVGIP
jgi:hypothetical protein